MSDSAAAGTSKSAMVLRMATLEQKVASFVGSQATASQQNEIKIEELRTVVTKLETENNWLILRVVNWRAGLRSTSVNQVTVRKKKWVLT